jgi:lipopolysaccharide biosynthesis regulator YciM
MASTRTPPDEKWVLNERAAVAGELQALEAELVRLAERKGHLVKLLTSLDEVYSQLAPVLPVVTMPVVKAHVRYGGRGNCYNWVREMLQAAYPKAVDTASLTTAAAEAFGLDLANANQRNKLRRNGIVPALHMLRSRGEAERLHDIRRARHLAGVWRWSPPGDSFAEVAVQAHAVERD